MPKNRMKVDTSLFIEEEPTILIDEDLPREFAYISHGKKQKFSKPHMQSYTPLQDDAQVITTELVAFTEEQSDSEKEAVIETNPDFAVESAAMSYLGIIENEDDYDFDRAI